MIRNFVDADIPQLQAVQYGNMAQEELRALIETWNKKEYEGNYFEMFAVAENGLVVGQASLYGRSEHIVSCGIEIYPTYRGKEYAFCAYRELLAVAKQKGYTLAVAQVRADNAESIALHKKAGFEAEEYTYVNKKGNSVYYFIKAL